MRLQDELVQASTRSYPHMFRSRVARTPDQVAFYAPNPTGSGPWDELTWLQAKEEIDILAAGLLALDLEPEQRVAIASSTRIEWVLIDMAIACAAGATTTIYPSTDVDDVTHIIRDSGSVFLVAENAAQLDKVIGNPDLGDQVRALILLDDDRDGAFDDPRIITWHDLQVLGRDFLRDHPDSVDAAVDTLQRDSLSTLIYTSGTTGKPKGVELLHGSWTYSAVAVEWLDFVHADDILYLWLPLSHVFGRVLLSLQMQVGFASAVDGRVDRIVAGLGEVRPTILVGVPRIFEKVRAAVITMNPSSGIKGRISRWAFAVGRDSRDYRLSGQRMPVSLRARYALADKLVYTKLKEKLGGRMRFMVSGSAKLSRQVQEWFYSAGLLLIEGYGLTETSAVAFFNSPKEPRFGTVGKVLAGVEARLADDGEVMLRGPIVTRGYHNLPEANQDAFTDGWFHTGDLGSLDGDGFLTVTDRKKDLIKTSNGKYVAPQRVENAIMANIPYVSQAVAVGENRPYVSALVALDSAALLKWGKLHGQPDADYKTLTQLPQIRNSIDRFMRRANTHLEPWEQVKKYAILDREFSLDDEELTPSMKVRRDVVLQRYSGTIKELYSDTVPFMTDTVHRHTRPEKVRKQRAKRAADDADSQAGHDQEPTASEQ